MRRSHDATVTSLLPWPIERSKRLPRAQRSSAVERETRPTPLAATRPPRWRPITSCSMPKRSQRPTVCAKSRAVTRTSSPRARSASMTGRMTRTWGLLVRSTQTRIADGVDDLGHLVALQDGAHRDGEVRARGLVGAGELARGRIGGHRRLAVDGLAVVGLVADAALRQRGGQLVGPLVA